MSQEQDDLAKMIFGLNETIVGRFDALNERIDRLEKTLTDDALALSSEHEALLARIRDQLTHSGGGLGAGVNHIYALVWSLVSQANLDPFEITESMDASMEDVD